jgi:hypothetical protein
MFLLFHAGWDATTGRDEDTVWKHQHFPLWNSSARDWLGCQWWWADLVLFFMLVYSDWLHLFVLLLFINCPAVDDVPSLIHFASCIPLVLLNLSVPLSLMLCFYCSKVYWWIWYLTVNYAASKVLTFLKAIWHLNLFYALLFFPFRVFCLP